MRDYNKVLSGFVTLCRETMQSRLVGVYLHGSLAMHCFHPDQSDIDLLVVIDGDITEAQKLAFMQRLVVLNEEAPAKGMEVSIVRKEYCSPFVYPTPFELHFSNMHLRWFRDNPLDYVQNMKGVDKDLAAHITVINHYGIVLDGEPIDQVFSQVPREDYADSIWCDIRDAEETIQEEPVYMILNLCRVAAFLEEGLCVSKQEGGKWGRENLPKKYRSVIDEALQCYQTGKEMQAEEELLKKFAAGMLQWIRSRMKDYEGVWK